MLKRIALRAIDLYLACIAAWALAWAILRDRKGGLALANAWAFWLLGPALPLGAARLWREGGRPRDCAASLRDEGARVAGDPFAIERRPSGVKWSIRPGRVLALSWVAGGSVLLASRYRWLLRSLPRLLAPRQGSPACPASLPGQAGASAARSDTNRRTRALRALSFNVLMENECPDSVLQLVRRENADVVLIQELEHGMNRALFAGLEGYDYCHWQSHPKPGGGFGFFSRYPFKVTGLWDFPATRPYACRITLDRPGGPADVYTVHLLSIGPKAMRKTGLDGNFRVREGQVRTLANEMAARPVPALALGDCNMTEGNEAYQQAAARMTDAWLAAGRGPGWTWPRRWGFSQDGDRRTQPMLRLDYCFCSSDVKPVAMRVLYDDVGSDHCPIVVDAWV